MIGKVVLFLRLYLFAFFKYLGHCQRPIPRGIHGSAVFLFFDPPFKDKLHGVVAFVIPRGKSVDSYSNDLWGPFGFSSQIDWDGFHLYGRDTWGTANEDQIAENPQLMALSLRYPNQTILLAGVRKLWRWHIWPLNDPNSFVLVENQ